MAAKRYELGQLRYFDDFNSKTQMKLTVRWREFKRVIDPFHVRENVSKLEDKTKEI